MHLCIRAKVDLGLMLSKESQNQQICVFSLISRWMYVLLPHIPKYLKQVVWCLDILAQCFIHLCLCSQVLMETCVALRILLVCWKYHNSTRCRNSRLCVIQKVELAMKFGSLNQIFSLKPNDKNYGAKIFNLKLKFLAF